MEYCILHIWTHINCLTLCDPFTNVCARDLCQKSGQRIEKWKHCNINFLRYIWAGVCLCECLRECGFCVCLVYYLKPLHTDFESTCANIHIWYFYCTFFVRLPFCFALLCIHVYYAYVFHKQFSPKQKMLKIVISTISHRTPISTELLEI